MATGMNRGGFTLGLNAPAPDSPPGSGGLVFALQSGDPSKVSVPATVTVPTGSTSTTVTLFGKASTLDAQMVDHPVTITAHAAGLADGTAAVSDADPSLQFSSPPAGSRTTNSPPVDLTVNVLNPRCQFCGDVLTDPLTLNFSVLDANTGAQSSIVTIGPPRLVLAAGTSSTQKAGKVTVGTPTGTGSYVISFSANGGLGIKTLTSGVVTVKQSSILTVTSGTVAATMNRGGFNLQLDSPAPDSPPNTGGLLVSFSFSDQGAHATADPIIVPTGQMSASFNVRGLVSTRDPSGDHPVTLTASAPGFSSQTSQISVADPVFSLNASSLPHTSSGTRVAISAQVINSGCRFCGDVLNGTLGVGFAAIDPSTNQTSSIVSLSPKPANVIIPGGGSSTANVQQVFVETPSATGTYRIDVSAAQGLATVSSAVVTVTPPGLVALAGGPVATHMHRDNIQLTLDSPAPTGGLTVNLKSLGAQVGVPDSVLVAAGSSSGSFAIQGLASTHDANGTDHPVTITATLGSTSANAQVSVSDPILSLSAGTLPHTTLSAPTNVSATVINPNCQFCGDVLIDPMDLTFAAIDPSTGLASAIVSLTPSSGAVTIPKDRNSTTFPSQPVKVGTPTATGNYRIDVSAPDAPTVSSPVVTVTQPSINFLESGTIPYGMSRQFTVQIDSPAPAGGLQINLGSTQTGVASVPASVVITAAQQSATFAVTGAKLQAGQQPQTIQISASAVESPSESPSSPSCVRCCHWQRVRSRTRRSAHLRASALPSSIRAVSSAERC